MNTIEVISIIIISILALYIVLKYLMRIIEFNKVIIDYYKLISKTNISTKRTNKMNCFDNIAAEASLVRKKFIEDVKNLKYETTKGNKTI